MFVHKEYLTALSWNTSRGNLKEVSHKHLKSAAAWGCFGDAVIKEKVPPQGDRQSERATKTDKILHGAPRSSAAQCGRVVSPHQHRSINSTSCWDRKVRCNALIYPTVLADPDHMHITHTLDVSHSLKHDCLSLMYHVICQVVFILGTKKQFYFSH